MLCNVSETLTWRSSSIATAVGSCRCRSGAINEVAAGAFLGAIRGTRFEALFQLLLVGGVRPGEAYALKWADVDFISGTVTIQRALSRVKSE